MSDLLTVREKFIEVSGRYNLAIDPNAGDYSDNGADYYINSGQRLLDGMLDHPKSRAEVSATLSAGDNTLRFDRVRAVEEVYLDLSDTKKYLTRLFIQELRDQFGKDADPAEPTHFAVGILRNQTQTAALFQKKGLVFQPPADVDYEVFVAGKFYQPNLVNDTDQSYWTLEHPDILLQAALYALEEKYRNSEGMADHMNAIRTRVEQLDNDVVEEEIAGADQMDDAWDHRFRMIEGFS